jgi:hypothetical protein
MPIYLIYLHLESRHNYLQLKINIYVYFIISPRFLKNKKLQRKNYYYLLFSLALQPSAGYGLLVHVVS